MKSSRHISIGSDCERRRASALARIEGPAGWFRLVLGLFLVFGLFHGSATVLGSDRGQRGILIGVLVGP